jgi:hypothetical protein
LQANHQSNHGATQITEGLFFATKIAILKANEGLSGFRAERETAGNAQKMSKNP